MDPYLEKPTLWPDVHHELISGIRATLTEQLRPRYYVRIEERVYVSGPADPGRTVLAPDVHLTTTPKVRPASPSPEASAAIAVAEPIVVLTLVDDEVRESYLEVIDAFGHEVVTVIEVLSPTNKIAGADGLDSFLVKRDRVMRSSTHWVEIDLLRAGLSPMSAVVVPEHEYVVHVSPVDRRPDGLVWPIRLSERLPVISIPLHGGDEDARLDLQSVLDTAYDRAGYDTTIDYTAEPDPPLSPAWQEWADGWLRQKGVR